AGPVPALLHARRRLLQPRGEPVAGVRGRAGELSRGRPDPGARATEPVEDVLPAVPRHAGAALGLGVRRVRRLWRAWELPGQHWDHRDGRLPWLVRRPLPWADAARTPRPDRLRAGLLGPGRGLSAARHRPVSEQRSALPRLRRPAGRPSHPDRQRGRPATVTPDRLLPRAAVAAAP